MITIQRIRRVQQITLFMGNGYSVQFRMQFCYFVALNYLLNDFCKGSTTKELNGIVPTNIKQKLFSLES